MGCFYPIYGVYQGTFTPMSDTKSRPDNGLQESSPAGAESARSVDELLAEAQAKLDEQRDAWLRALADAENARKRAQADIAQARKYAAERIVEDLLPVMDSLEAALEAAGASPDAMRAGIELTLRQLRSAFERAGVAEVNPGAGQRFDPHRHQAMAAVQAAPGEKRDPNTVVSVMQKGYSLHDRVLRPALVTVAKAVEKRGANPISDTDLDQN